MNDIEVFKRAKEKTKELIEIGEIELAKGLVKQYEDILISDVDVYSIRAIIEMIEGNIDLAEKILLDGYLLNSYDSDLLYNLGYLYYTEGRYLESELSYFLAKLNCREESQYNDINEKLENVRLKLGKKLDFDVILYGDIEKCIEFINRFKSEINIIGYIKNNIGVNNNECGINSIDIKEINDIKYNYIVITDTDNEESLRKFNELVNLGLKKDKIYLSNKLNMQFPIEGFKYKLLKFMRMDKIETVVTGLSYAEVGIDCDFLGKNSINFALSSQDIYYDYKILQYLMRFDKVANNLKNVIINLSYYSLDYDLSKTSEALRIHRYYPIIQEPHNYEEEISFLLLNKLYDLKWKTSDYENMSFLKANTIIGENCIIKGKEYAIHHSNFNYSETFAENLDILESMINVLSTKNISVTILICPVSKYYYKYYDKQKIKKFYDDIELLINKYDIKVLDYFDSNIFKLTDFWDDSHLNRNGMVKLTKLLNDQIVNKDE
jgi:hypothetical protein